MRTIPVALTLAILAGCPPSTATPPEDLSTCSAEGSHDFEIVAADTGGAAAVIEGDILSVDVAYGGGCEEHLFSLCWPDGAFMESEPVQVNLEIWHGGPADMCEAYLMDTLTFDLAPLQAAWKAAYGDGPGTIIVHLADSSDELSYAFD